MWLAASVQGRSLENGTKRGQAWQQEKGSKRAPQMLPGKGTCGERMALAAAAGALRQQGSTNSSTLARWLAQWMQMRQRKLPPRCPDGSRPGTADTEWGTVGAADAVRAQVHGREAGTTCMLQLLASQRPWLPFVPGHAVSTAVNSTAGSVAYTHTATGCDHPRVHMRLSGAAT